MSEETINQRLKLLIERLSPSVRAFSEAIGDSYSNTQNYIGTRQLAPKHEYIAKVLNHFSTVNAHWLLTGIGSPFLSPTTENDLASTTNQKFFRSQIVGNNQGINSQNENSDSGELVSLKSQLLLAQNDNEHLRAQLAMKDALLASKEETINLLRAAYTRPN